MPTLTFLVSLPLFLISAGIFGYALVQVRRDNPRARDTMTIGVEVGFLAVVVAAIVFSFFS
jgi:hypothetical protein